MLGKIARAALIAGMLLGGAATRAADLVVWSDKGFSPAEDEALIGMMKAFEAKTGKKVELTLAPDTDLTKKAQAAVDAGTPPDVLFGTNVRVLYDRWALEGRLHDLTTTVGTRIELFHPLAADFARRHNSRTGRRALYVLPIGMGTDLLHAWTGLLENAGLKREYIPTEWHAFWSFWCDRAQPAVRKALGRDDIWGLGLPMGPDAPDTFWGIGSFILADGLSIYIYPEDNRFSPPGAVERGRLVHALDHYVDFYRRGCVPPDAIEWTNTGNNKAFLDQRVVMTINQTLSIPNALLPSRPDDYYKNTRTLLWPRRFDGSALVAHGIVFSLAVPATAAHLPAAEEFVRFLLEDLTFADYLVANRQRFLPAMPKLLEMPFWLDSSDPHMMAAAYQLLTQPLVRSFVSNSDAWRTTMIHREFLWPKAVHKVATGAATAEQAVDAVLARMTEIWALPAPPAK